jgi:predicted RNase H-like nuclease (RuvC/YqgF family)
VDKVYEEIVREADGLRTEIARLKEKLTLAQRWCIEAADEIERLKAELAEFRNAAADEIKRSQEREACAQIADEWGKGRFKEEIDAAESIAAAIRARQES